MNNAIYYLIVKWNEFDEPEQREFWDIQKAFKTAKEYEKQKNWIRIEIFKSTIRKKEEEIQPDKLYYIKTNN